MAPQRSGLSDPYRIEAFAMQALAHDVADALATPQLGLDQALELLAPRPDCQGRMPWPRLGQPTAAAILTAIGEIGTSTNGQQLGKLAGLDLRLCDSGRAMLSRRGAVEHPR